MKIEARAHIRRLPGYTRPVEIGRPRQWRTWVTVDSMEFAELFGEELLVRLTTKWQPVKVTLEVVE